MSHNKKLFILVALSITDTFALVDENAGWVTQQFVLTGGFAATLKQ